MEITGTRNAYAKGYTYTFTGPDGATLIVTSKKNYRFALAGTGNQWHPSGLWCSLRMTREAALGAMSKHDGGVIITF